jgi:hypothetical protein
MNMLMIKNEGSLSLVLRRLFGTLAELLLSSSPLILGGRIGNFARLVKVTKTTIRHRAAKLTKGNCHPKVRYNGAEIMKAMKMPKFPNALWKPIALSNCAPR